MSVETDKSRVVVLCERLAGATRIGEINWRREGEDTFVWEAEEASVSIGSRDKDGEPPYQLLVLNANGETLEELTSELLENDDPAEWNEPLATLYRAALRKALGADEIIEALIERLPARRAARASGSSSLPAEGQRGIPGA
jgi:ankyrin repeat protein